MALSASAQSAESSLKAGNGANAVAPLPYNKVMFTYSPLSLKEGKFGNVGAESRQGGINSLGLTYVHGFPLAQFPLYVEFGGGVQYMFYHNKKNDAKFDVISVNVPVNILYRFALNGGKQHIAPYAGLYGRYNAWGKGGDDSLFGDDGDLKRFQMGWQVGFQYDVSKFYIHLAYLSDISSCNKGSVSDQGIGKAKSYLGGFIFGVGVVF